jgi:branched-chain amino acid transport system permease protein
MTKANRWLPWLLLALALFAPAVVYPVFLMKALCFALFASAFNLLVGYAGLLSFGHAAFFGAAAYVTAHAMKVWGVPPELGLLLGTGCGTLLGLVFGWLAIRRTGIYFAMITLALSQVVYFYAVQAPWTGGEDGIQAVPRGTFLGLVSLEPSLNLYYFILGVFLLGLAVIHRTIHSPFGHVLQGIRENEPRMVSLGYKVQRYKLMAFVLSAALAGLAGSAKTLVFQLASLSDLYWGMSGEVVLMTLVGGLATVAGPVIGAFALVTMSLYLAPFGSWMTVVQGTIFIVCVMFLRDGILGELVRLKRFWLGRTSARSADAAQTATAVPAFTPAINNHRGEPS